MQDVKRYGITIYRRRVNVSNAVEAVTDKMEARDPRLAVHASSGRHSLHSSKLIPELPNINIATKDL